MAWEAVFYEKGRGQKPVARFLRDLSKQARSKCARYIVMLEKYGYSLPSSYLEKVRDEIWALRPEYNNCEYRIFFFDAGNNRFIIVHIIMKNTRRIPPDDIATAESRRLDWLSRQEMEVG